MNHANELARDFRVIVPDMRGNGQSERVESIGPSDWVDDVDALMTELNISEAHFYGNAHGARIALRFAIDYPHRVKTLLLENTILAFEQGGHEAMNARMADPDAMPEETKQRYERNHGRDWRPAVRLFYNWRNDPVVHAHHDIKDKIGSLKMPILLTRGNAREQIHPMAHSFLLYETVPTAKMWIKPEGGMLATPEGYQRIRDFIAETSQKATPV
jgi:pimeloyl-ACP methyl ester carboxylesterase